MRVQHCDHRVDEFVLSEWSFNVRELLLAKLSDKIFHRWLFAILRLLALPHTVNLGELLAVELAKSSETSPSHLESSPVLLAAADGLRLLGLSLT